MFDRIFGQSSARVVAIARLALALVFVASTAATPEITRARPIDELLLAYTSLSAAVLWITWKNWWVDAKIAAATHVADIFFFMILVAWPEGYASPFFLFFIFLLLSATIRWGWQATALTAAVVVALYVAAGLLGAGSGGSSFQLQRFVIRTGYLVVLSLLLIWFGLRRRFTTGRLAADLSFGLPAPDESPLAAALAASKRVVGAQCALLTWQRRDGQREALCFRNGELTRLALTGPAPPFSKRSFLFDLRNDRVLLSSESGSARFHKASALIEPSIFAQISTRSGLAVPIRNHLGEGLFLFTTIPHLHSDHLELGDLLGVQLTHLLERHALVSAHEEAAVDRERLRLARDLHDGVVQFLAGSTYKVEAISRAIKDHRDVSTDLQELKDQFLIEQQDLRSSIAALRSDDISLSDIEDEARSLCGRLGRQWQIECRFESEIHDARTFARLRFDVLQIIKEAVANAVRHSSANMVQVRLRGDADCLELSVTSDGAAADEELRTDPWSIRERVENAGGTMNLSLDGMGSKLAVQLPLSKDEL